MRIRSGVTGRNYTDRPKSVRREYFDRPENRVTRSGFPVGENIRVSARVPGTGIGEIPARFYRTDRFIRYPGVGFSDRDFVPRAVRS